MLPWAETVETKEALQGNPKKTLGFLLMPGIVISSVSKKGTCLGIAQTAVAHLALQYAQAGEQTFNASLPDWESRA